MTAPRDPGENQRGAAPRRSRMRWWLLGTLLVLLALGGLLRWASRPEQVANLVLTQAGRALGLKITARGVSEYRLRGVPQIVLREVTAQREGDAVPVLEADRILLSVPWSTLKSRGRDLTVHRVELQRPHVDIAAVQRWLATRTAAGPTRTPRLTDGLVVREGEIAGPGWAVRSLDLDVPSVAPDRPVRGHLDGELVAGATRMPFNLHMTLARPAAGAGLGAAGRVIIQRPDWRLELDDVRLRGRPSAVGELALEGLVLGARATWRAGKTSLPFTLGLGGRAAYRDALRVAPLGLALRQGREIPDLSARGNLEWGRAFVLALDGDIAHWPRRWPTLPAPIGRPRGPLPLSLVYRGPTDLSGETALRLRSGRTDFDANFRLPHILRWLDASARGGPIPPLRGRMSTPVLEIPGARLEGVEIEIGDDRR